MSHISFEWLSVCFGLLVILIITVGTKIIMCIYINDSAHDNAGDKKEKPLF